MTRKTDYRPIHTSYQKFAHRWGLLILLTSKSAMQDGWFSYWCNRRPGAKKNMKEPEVIEFTSVDQNDRQHLRDRHHRWSVERWPIWVQYCEDEEREKLKEIITIVPSFGWDSRYFSTLHFGLPKWQTWMLKSRKTTTKFPGHILQSNLDSSLQNSSLVSAGLQSAGE